MQPLRMALARSLASSGNSSVSNKGGRVISANTCRMKVMGLLPMAWASPMLALITFGNGFLTPAAISFSRAVALMTRGPRTAYSIFLMEGFMLSNLRLGWYSVMVEAAILPPAPIKGLLKACSVVNVGIVFFSKYFFLRRECGIFFGVF